MDYAQFLPSVLFVLGSPVQYLRAYKGVPDFVTYIIAAVVAGGGYALCHSFTADIRLEIIQGLIWMPGGVGSMLGGTFAASGAAKAGLAVVPMTNSK